MSAGAFSKADFRRIQWSVVILVILALLGAAVVFGALQLTKAAQAEARKVEAERGDIRNKLARARDEEQDIRARIARYQELVERGYVTEEQRLDWIERIAQIKAARKLIDVQYELMPQKPVEAGLLPEGNSGGGYEFMSSAMKLQMQLLHEDDLLGFLTDLRARVRALIVVRQCAVERIPRGATSERGVQAQLKADCEIDWITLREKR
ncbi:hypothetical protein [Sulfurisoma sediminicola]|uniref:Uncharacterized protein n=1 Tax=Sulfurisoma sediminicola TaxID=1381557 RepID=A0A497XBV1_9PROT|nr:hypothetical protein [Sulfurisoma sediminicola]RLJ63749.1 hypothetical protein DFR35_2381 [Sulfurisoma sediminicola]